MLGAPDRDTEQPGQKKDEERRQAQVRQEAERLRQQTAEDEKKKAQEVAKAEAQAARKKAQEQPRQQSPQLHYTVLKDDTTSVPGKVLQELLVAPDITKADLQNLLQARYEEVRRRSFTYQNHRINLINVGIYAYPSREHAAGGQNWIGMLFWASDGDRSPTISLRPGWVKYLLLPKSGLVFLRRNARTFLSGL